MKINLLIVSIFLLLLTACTSNEIANSKDVNQNKIYIKYTIKYIEGNTLADVKAQFRFASYRGTTLILNPPSTILLDNKPLKAERNYFSGAYYTISPEIKNLLGLHYFTLTLGNSKPYKESFVFAPFTMNDTMIITASKKSDLIISYKGLQEGDVISITIKDTSEATENLYLEKIIKSGEIIITAQELQQLKSGTIYIITQKNEIHNLTNSTENIGSIEINYLLKEKTILLKD